MEEKERYYSLIDHNGNFELRDYESGTSIYSLFELDELLNQQDKRIRELERIGDKGHLNDLLEDKRKENKILIRAIEQLQQTQKQLAMSELEKLKKSILGINKTEIKVLENGYSTLYCDRPEVITIIENQIKKLRGENLVC